MNGRKQPIGYLVQFYAESYSIRWWIIVHPPNRSDQLTGCRFCPKIYVTTDYPNVNHSNDFMDGKLNNGGVIEETVDVS